MAPTKPTLPKGSDSGDVSSEDEPDEPEAHTPKRISFPVESILNAVIQDGDVLELLHILCYQLSEININQRNHSGLTALHYAVLTNNLDSIKLLINYGADVTVQDIHGFSPLHTAAALGYLHVTALLIVYGADVFSLTNHSELPVDLAKDISVVRLLSYEMYSKLQREQHLKSLAIHVLRRTGRVTMSGVLFICKTILLLVQHLLVKSSDYISPYLGSYSSYFVTRRQKPDTHSSLSRSSSLNRKQVSSTNKPCSNKSMVMQTSPKRPSLSDLNIPNQRNVAIKED